MSERQYDLLAVDLDGTLLTPDGSLSSATRRALHRAHESGMRIVLCTGRSFTETRDVIGRIGLELDATVTVGGALLTDVATGCTIERTEIPIETAHAASRWLQQRGYPVLWLLDAHEAGFDGFVVGSAPRHPAIERWLRLAPVSMRDCADLPQRQAPIRLTIVDETDALENVSAELRRVFDRRLNHNIIAVRSYGFTVIESFAHPVDKWFGILKLCRRWNIDPARTVAIGDDVNDLPMIRSAGLGVAVANAIPQALAAAARVVPDNAHDGVAVLIDSLLSQTR
ncbi:MAG: HAD family hydrolase [Phycisphaerae bacterium]|nr:HAD-IIB family hydrolase [Phycisphaerae bacterium]MCZ2401050.1 HAD family hydrolase [Phycisphaerae bacterium]NUQ50003.1 HAD-IIB family hydrolase [Phycisphaerae bacterium]